MSDPSTTSPPGAASAGAELRPDEHRTEVHEKRRTIIIGDVHGCADELEELLDTLAFEPARDALYFVGDLLARGPFSVRVLELVAQLGRSVRGNHEERLLRADQQRRRGERVQLHPLQEALYEQLEPAHWTLLRSLPLSIALPAHGLRIVHAGLVPGVPLQRQEPALMLNIRSLDPSGKPSVRFGKSWAPHWTGPEQLIFGHNAVAGLQLERFATGLDTGCVYGKELTALVLSAGEPVPEPKERAALLRTVRARRAYWGVVD